MGVSLRHAAFAAVFFWGFPASAKVTERCGPLFAVGGPPISKDRAAELLEEKLADITGGAFVVADEKGLSVRVTNADAKWQVESRYWLGWHGYVVHSRLAYHDPAVIDRSGRKDVGAASEEALRLKYLPKGVELALAGWPVPNSMLRPKTNVEKTEWEVRELLAQATARGVWPTRFRIEVEKVDRLGEFLRVLHGMGKKLVVVKGVYAADPGRDYEELTSVDVRIFAPETFLLIVAQPGVQGVSLF